MVTDMDTDLLSERDPNTAIFYQTYQPMEVLGRGVSSVVRRMLYRKSGQSYAVKIIDVSSQLQPQKTVGPGHQSSPIHGQTEETEGVAREAESDGGRQLPVQDAAIQKGP